MKKTIFLGIFFLPLLFISCSKKQNDEQLLRNNWEQRKVDVSKNQNLTSGTTYLSVYSQIYSLTEHRLHDLTATVSIRNVSESDSIFITHANYYDANGKMVKNYFNDPIYLSPMETVEIIINEDDPSGGTGANFLFRWKIGKDTPKPFFEAVMISTSGQQGLSFTTQGIEPK